MSFIFIILLIAFSFLYFYTEKRLSNESMQILHKVADSGGRTDFLYKESESFRQKLSNYPTFYVNINNYGQINSIVGYSYPLDSIEYSSLKEMVQKVLSLEKQTGDLPGRSLRYLVSSTTKGKVIVFLDTTNEIITLKHLIKNLVVVGVFSLVAFFIISLILARVTVAPVEKSWNQQKQLVADASHELKTPLTVILSNTDMILADCPAQDEALARRAENIRLEGDRMRGLITDMLTLARSDEGTRQSEPSVPVRLSSTVENACLAFDALAYEQGLTLTAKIQPDCLVLGQESRLAQLISILLDNAVKYSLPGGEVVVDLRSDRRGNVCLSVSNPSDPLTPEQAERLFDRFYRVDEARSVKSGYGLGLAVARQITDSHRGRIWCEYLNGCAVFNVQLPLFKNG